MSRRGLVALVVVVCGAASGCIDALLGPEPDPGDPLENFDILWRDFDRHYSFFTLKAIDWAAVRDSYRARVRPTTTEPELLEIVADMLDTLRDGHVNVFTEHGVYSYTDWFIDRPGSYNPHLVALRMNGTLTRVPDGTLEHGRPGFGIGYIRIPSFEPGMTRQVDVAIAALAGAGALDALVVDLRHNGGGSDGQAREAAGRLVSDRRLYRTVRYRNGPGHDDFTPHIPSHVEPAGPIRVTGPVAVLVNRRTFSAAESFVLAARTRQDVLVVGDTTGGGSGFPMYRELPNGWTYRLSRWISYDPTGRPFEGVGLVPDEVLAFETDDFTDSILDRALELLLAQLDG